MEYKADHAEVVSALQAIVSESQIVELRALQVPGEDGIKRNYSGFFNDIGLLASAGVQLSDAGAKGVYFTPNPVKEGPKTEHINTLTVGSRGKSATDRDIEEVNWLLIDIDPVRKAGLAATADEKGEAKAVCANILTYLTKLGWPKPLLGDSGNGYHLLYRVSGVTSDTIREFLDVLGDMFSTDGAEVDRLVFNPSRIWKMYGTWPRKGDNDPSRPWRKASLLNPEEVLVPVSMQQLEGTVSVVSSEKRADEPDDDAFNAFDEWVTENFPSLGPAQPWQDKGRRWVFDVCPWDSSHTDRSAYIVQFNNGSIAAGCLHENCEGNERDDEGKHLGWKRLQGVAGSDYVSPTTREPIPASPSTIDSPNLTDLGNAKRLIRASQNELLYCAAHGAWYIFQESHWRRDSDGAVFRVAKRAVGLIFEEALAEPDTDRQATLRRHALRSESSRSLNAMVSVASTESEVVISSQMLDASPWLFNVSNGTIDLRTGKMQQHDRTDFITKKSSVVYDPTASCPLWDDFLTYAMEEDEEIVEFINRFFGYCLTGLVTEQVLLFMEGTGSNGKTTALLILMHILGDYAIQGAPGLLLAKQGDAHPTEVADLEGTRFVANSEVEKGKPFAESLIKQLTGNDKIRARRMRQDFYEFDPTHKLCIAANHRPIIKGNDEGIWRRIIRIPWKRAIPADKKDPFFLDKLKKEAPGILNKLVAGCLVWQEKGLQPPEKVRLATSDYREEMDVLADFMEEKCLLGEQHKVGQKELYMSYVDWCEELKQKPQNYRLFNRQLKERDFETLVIRAGGVTTRAWKGVGLRNERASVNSFFRIHAADA